MKKIISILIAIFTIFLQITPGLAFYSDVPENHSQYEAVSALYQLSLLPEYEDNLFHPDEKFTKTDFYEFILSYANIDLSTEINLPYTDTDNTATYAPYIQTAIDIGILKPKAFTTEFKPEIHVNKSKTLSQMFEILGIGTTYFFDTEDFPFIDLRTDSDKAKIAMKAAELGIFEQNNPEYFVAPKHISRAEAASYLYNIYNYNPSSTIKIEYINTSEQKNTVSITNKEDLSIFLSVWEALQTEYLYQEELNNEEMVYDAIQGLLTEVDDSYTSFHEPIEAEAFWDSLTTTEYEGVGMMVELIDGNVTIISPFKDSPAEKAGLLPNDIIIEVDDENIIGQSLEIVIGKIKGPAQTKVKLKILRGAQEQELEFEITRDFILYKSVNYEILKRVNKDIGYIQIFYFGTSTYYEFLEAVDVVTEQDLDGLIIDLRNNPGGYMNEAINITDLFLEEIKVIVILEYADEQEKYRATANNNLLSEYETVVLINEGSASASEIMAGALQDQEKATIIGTQSFGKGTVQQVEQYGDGSMFKYTISKWLTPDGTDIEDKGITPDIYVEGEDEQLERAIEEI
jgi:carboxyl-terminal processing protease